MPLPTTLLSAYLALAASSPATGTIGGVVVDAANGQPVPGATVVLRVTVEGQLVPAEEAVADGDGRFAFRGLPASPQYVYLPGANCDGVHYPGPRLRLTPLQTSANVRLEVCRAVAEPNPLVVRHHRIAVRLQPDALRVWETMIVDNPTPTCFVGRANSDDEAPVTLSLSIPPDFERTTFAKEFFGRRFSVVGEKLVTSIPFTPGEREIAFAYTLPRGNGQPVWRRPLDLPTEVLEVTVRSNKPDEVGCNLDRQAVGGPREAVFRCGPEGLPAAYVLRVQFGAAPFSLSDYAPWLALATLGVLIAATWLSMHFRRRRQRGRNAQPRPPAEDEAARKRRAAPHSRPKANRRTRARP